MIIRIFRTDYGDHFVIEKTLKEYYRYITFDFISIVYNVKTKSIRK
jgi:hypothetical protein